MPNIKSSKKRVETNTRNKMRNKSNRSLMKTQVKKFDAAVKENNVALAEKLVPVCFSVIDETVTKGAIHKNSSNRRKQIISKKLIALKTANEKVSPTAKSEEISEPTGEPQTEKTTATKEKKPAAKTASKKTK